MGEEIIARRDAEFAEISSAFSAPQREPLSGSLAFFAPLRRCEKLSHRIQEISRAFSASQRETLSGSLAFFAPLRRCEKFSHRIQEIFSASQRLRVKLYQKTQKNPLHSLRRCAVARNFLTEYKKFFLRSLRLSVKLYQDPLRSLRRCAVARNFLTEYTEGTEKFSAPPRETLSGSLAFFAPLRRCAVARNFLTEYKKFSLRLSVTLKIT